MSPPQRMKLPHWGDSQPEQEGGGGGGGGIKEENGVYTEEFEKEAG